MRIWPSLILLVFFFSSCKKESSVNSKIIDLPPYGAVSIEDSFEVELVEDSVHRIEIYADNSLDVEKAEAKVIDGKLHIIDNRKFKWLKPKSKIKLILTSPEFKKIELFGGVKLSNNTPLKSEEVGIIFNGMGNLCDLVLDNKVFYFWNVLKAGGDINLRGETDVIKLWYSSLVSINTIDLNANAAILITDTELDCHLKVLNQIEYEIKNKGNIFVKGAPSIILNQGIDGDKNGRVYFID